MRIFTENPYLFLTLAVLVLFAVYLILNQRKDQGSDAEAIEDVIKAGAETLGSSDQLFAPSANFVAKARVKGMDGYHAL
ncbi:MAG TPA: hypothetical protein DCY41_03815, partial [Opitutae bacterium]|nr:hypothetical protein [Opitutae bacterium]